MRFFLGRFEFWGDEVGGLEFFGVFFIYTFGGGRWSSVGILVRVVGWNIYMVFSCGGGFFVAWRF